MNARFIFSDSNDRELRDFFERQQARENIKNTLAVERDKADRDRQEEIDILRKHI